MTREELSELFEKHDEEYLKNKTGGRADLRGFILLDKLVPGNGDIVSCAEHDEIWLSIEPDKLAEVATEEDIIDLIRCGVRLDDSNDSFAMFV